MNKKEIIQALNIDQSQIQRYPNLKTIKKVIENLRHILFFDILSAKDENLSRIELRMDETYLSLKEEISVAYQYLNLEDRSDEIVELLFNELSEIKIKLLNDARFSYESDPACTGLHEIIFTYPGFYAISIYRIANVLYKHKVPIIPRMMSELAHTKTGIDIHPGATIGNYFFIDHGTGIVIGETAIIEDHVKIYQNVTLGALSLKEGRSLVNVKRHPTIEHDVTLYAGSTILGGSTTIGHNSIIGGNAFIVESIKPNTKVTVEKQKLVLKETK